MQTLDVELGQSVQLGHSLAKVGSDQQLIARLRLPQSKADQININASVIIHTGKGLIKGHISRIETRVHDGFVLAEAVLDSPLTSNARPALSITAEVFVKHLPSAIYIPQIAGFHPRSSQTIFVRNGNRLRQRQITLGDLSQNKLLIATGLIPGE